MKDKNSVIVGIIPARGGSKGVPKKNIKKLCGKPLICYTIETAIKSNIIDKIIVSTDDEETARKALALSVAATMQEMKTRIKENLRNK